MKRIVSIFILMIIPIISCNRSLEEIDYNNPYDREGIVYVPTNLTATFSPANSETDVATDTNIVITFSHEVNQTNSWSVNVGGVVYDRNSSEVSWNGNVLTINPATYFTRGDTIAVSLSGFTAQFDNVTLSGTISISFRTYVVFPVADTGQTRDYTTTFGEDSDYVNIPNARSFTGPTQHATYTGDYTTMDNVTGLIWKSCPEGQSGADCLTGTAQTYTWDNAKSACTALNSANSNNGYGGRADWRLPIIEELNTLPNYGISSPAIDMASFPGIVSSKYWSSTTTANNTTVAWLVKFSLGSVDYDDKSSWYHVRCVAGP